MAVITTIETEIEVISASFLGLTAASHQSSKKRLRKVHGRLNASWKISSLAVNGQSFLVIDGYLLIGTAPKKLM